LLCHIRQHKPLISIQLIKMRLQSLLLVIATAAANAAPAQAAGDAVGRRPQYSRPNSNYDTVSDAAYVLATAGNVILAPGETLVDALRRISNGQRPRKDDRVYYARDLDSDNIDATSEATTVEDEALATDQQIEAALRSISSQQGRNRGYDDDYYRSRRPGRYSADIVGAAANILAAAGETLLSPGEALVDALHRVSYDNDRRYYSRSVDAAEDIEADASETLAPGADAIAAPEKAVAGKTLRPRAFLPGYYGYNNGFNSGPYG
jgi:hypothetical protein